MYFISMIKKTMDKKHHQQPHKIPWQTVQKREKFPH